MSTLEERITRLEHEVSILKAEKLKLAGSQIGDYFELAGLKWRILDITPKGYHCLAEDSSKNKIFDYDSNNWIDSSLRKWLNGDFLDKLAAEIGEKNIIEFERDLLSLDGQMEHGKCCDKVSLLNIDEYRKYRPLILSVNSWWWLITPWGTRHNNFGKWLTIVSCSGSISNGCCDDYHNVRPFCIFSSEIFE